MNTKLMKEKCEKYDKLVKLINNIMEGESDASAWEIYEHASVYCYEIYKHIEENKYKRKLKKFKDLRDYNCY